MLYIDFAMIQAKPQAILFDLDDTIITSFMPREETWRIAARRFGPRIAAIDSEELVAAISCAADEFWACNQRFKTGRLDLKTARRKIVEIACTNLGHAVNEHAHAMADFYTHTREEELKPFPGALETLAHFRKSGVKLGLITNGAANFQRRKIERFALEPYFDGIFIEGEVGHGKPEVAAYENALRTLQVSAPDTWIVGDNFEWEVVAPHHLGFYTVWHDHEGRGLPANAAVRPHRVVQRIRELID